MNLMISSLRSVAIIVFTLIAHLTASLQAATPLPQDARILTGKLPNGVTWCYREHNNPPGKMAIKIHVRTGSLNETDGQRGLAHFMEHMAFNGTEHFAPGKLVPYFESIGMQFGPHLNAFTSFDQTVYMLYTPNTEVEQVDKALTVLSDYAFRALLTEDEINKERGIILEESRGGKNANQRVRDKLWPQLFEGSRFAQRMPIGNEEVIAKAPKAEFDDYYRTWYRPENITVVMVGDAKPDAYLPLIAKWFGEYKPSSPLQKPHGAEFTAFKTEKAIVVTDPEQAFCQIMMVNILPADAPTTTVEQYREDLVKSVAGWIMGRRFDQLVKQGKANFRSGSTTIDDFFHEGTLVGAFAIGEGKDWEKMLRELVLEVNRARKYGFNASELELATKDLIASAERAERTEGTRNASQVIDEILEGVNEHVPVLSAAQTFALQKRLLPGVTLADLNAMFVKYFQPGPFAYTITMSGKDASIIPTEAQVIAAAQKAATETIEAPKESTAPKQLLAKPPTPGRVVESTLDADLGVTSAWLRNNVRVHHRFMDYKKDSVLVSIALAGGTIEETKANLGITTAATLAIDEAATKKISSSAMRDLMTGKNISVSADDRKDHLLVTVTGSPLDLEVGLQQAYLLLTEGIIEETAFNNWKLSSLQSFDQREKMPTFKAQEAMESLLSGGDVRRRFVGKTEVESLKLPAIQKWYERLCKQAPIEVSVVGDITYEKVLPLVLQYIGSLPKRPRALKGLDAMRQSPRPPGPYLKDVIVNTVTPQAMAITGFAAAEGRNTHDSQAMEMASLIVSSRLVKQIREELAIVYSIHASHTPSWIYRDGGRFLAGAPCDPKNAARVIEQANKIYAAFAATGPTEVEITNAHKQVNNSLDVNLREPSYWWGILRNLDLKEMDLNAQKTIRQDMEKLTAADVQAVFKKYYVEARKFSVTASPVKP